MKLIKISLILVIIFAMFSMSYGLPDVSDLTTNECRICHGDTTILHHSLQYSGCAICHPVVFPTPPDGWRECSNCHVDFDHHDTVTTDCTPCHDNQIRNRFR